MHICMQVKDKSAAAAGAVVDSNESNVSECVPEEYHGDACRSQLSHLQGCFNNETGFNSETDISSDANNSINICVGPQNSQKDQEDIAQALKFGLNFVPTISDACKEKLEPFACLYLFPLAVYKDTTGLGPTARSCEVIRDKLCTDVWDMIERLGYNLPSCEELKEEQIDLIQSCAGKKVWYVYFW